MKRFKTLSIYIGLLCSASTIVFSGCTKNEQKVPVVENRLYITPTSQQVPGQQSFSINISPTPLSVRLGAAVYDPAPGDIQVSFAIDPSLIDSFNVKNGTSYISLPDGSFDLATNDVSIASGETVSSKDSIIINSMLLQSCQTYLLPVKITNVSGSSVAMVGNMIVRYYVIYVAPSYNPNAFQGNFVVVSDAADNFASGDIVALTKMSDTQFSFKYPASTATSPVPVVVTVDPVTFLANIPVKTSAGAQWTWATNYTGAYIETSATTANSLIDPCSSTVTLELKIGVDQGYFGGLYKLVLRKQ